MDVAAAEFLEDAQSLHRARHEERLFDVVGRVDALAVEHRVKKLLCIDHAAKIVQVLIRNREHVVRRPADNAQLLTPRLRQIDPRDTCARRHECGRSLIAHVENTIHHVLLRLLERAVLRPLLHEILHRILRRSGAILRTDAKEQQEPARNRHERRARQRREPRQKADAAMTAQKNVLRAAQRDLLGQKIAKEQRQRGHDDDAQHERRSKDLHPRQEMCEESPERGRNEQSHTKPDEETHAGHARLRHRDGLFRMLEQRERRRRIGVAVERKLFETPAVRARQRRLDLRKIRVRRQTHNEQYETDKIRSRTIQEEAISFDREEISLLSQRLRAVLHALSPPINTRKFTGSAPAARNASCSSGAQTARSSASKL